MKAFIDIFRTLPQQSTPLSVLQHPTYMQAPETNKIGQSTTEGGLHVLKSISLHVLFYWGRKQGFLLMSLFLVQERSP